MSTFSEAQYRASQRRLNYEAAREAQHRQEVYDQNLRPYLEAQERQSAAMLERAASSRREVDRELAERQEEQRRHQAEQEGQRIRSAYFAANPGATQAEFERAWPTLLSDHRARQTAAALDAADTQPDAAADAIAFNRVAGLPFTNPRRF